MTGFGVRTLTAKLLSIFIPFVCLSLFGSFVVQELSFFKAQRTDLVERLERLLDVQNASFVSALWEFDTDQVKALAKELMAQSFVTSVAVYDKSGTVLVAKGPYERPPEFANYRAAQQLIHQENKDTELLGRLVLTVHGGEIRAAVIAHAKASALVLLVLIIALVAGAILATRVFITRPLNQLRASIEHAKTGKLREPVLWQSNDELGQVVAEYNEMQARQAEAEAEVKRYQDGLEELVDERTKQLSMAHNLITESVEYAANIQRAALPFDELLGNAFADHFVIWEPRDIVGGDMYWFIPVPDGFVFGVADCTGHGVPGAFVTLLASGALRHALAEYPDGNPAKLISSMNNFIKEVLGQYTEDSISDDGLEMGLCLISTSKSTMTYAGARISLWECRNGRMREIRGDKTGIGYKDVPINLKLTNHILEVYDDATYYIFSDGFSDQVGGPKRRGLGKKRVLESILENQGMSLSSQSRQIMSMFSDYQGDEIRRDDLTMVGFRFGGHSRRPLIRP